MCGLAGFWNRSPDRPAQDLRAMARRMADTLRHRGPNDAGTWDDPAAGYAVGFRRLSIIDLSPHGHQPMASDDGRLVLAFNGEIYNHADVRAELGEGRRYRGHSDTEVMLRAFARWGTDGAVRRFVGMFAFALWDRKDRVLTLGRDRLGEKPLYYGRFGDTFLFGSELKALRAHPEFRGEIDRDALAEFMRLGYIPTPQSIYRGIFKLPPGALLTVGADPSAAKPVPYWSARTAVLNGLAKPMVVPAEEAVERLDAELRRTVREQLVADVPLGAFLSGGTDSSTVVGVMQSLSPRPVKTFTIGFEEAEYDEAAHARAVAKHLGTEHTELYVTAAEARAVVPDLPRLWDEPFADASQVPTYLVSRLAARQVVVSLSGDGGDELFAGYRWYQRSNRLWNQLRWTPRVARHAVAAAIAGIPAGSWDRVLNRLRPLVPARMRRDWTGDRLHKFADLIGDARCVEGVYDGFTSARWAGPDGVVLGARPVDPACRPADVPDPIHRLMLRDLLRYLPDNILAKVDRASMAASLESRAPLLDHRIVEFACRVPLGMKIHQGRGKWLLRRALHRYVPPALVERPKMGFEVPIDHWLRGPLRDWASDLLSPARLGRDGFLDPRVVRKKLDEHVSGERNWHRHLWRAVVFQTWLEAR
ncbi:MAG TPA: asparagine synthase (glutamine-hydrolyzing) [Gemmataceae bacterium]|nr:asparagine synthase (glutamine-hydrolyzing) [Gemmataceae bacterium]